MFDRKEATKHIGAGVLQGFGGTIYAGVIFLLGLAVAWFVSRGEGPGQNPMTRWDWVLITLIASGVIAIVFYVAVDAYPKVANIWREWFAKVDAPRETPSTLEAEAPSSPTKPAIDFVIEGNWLNTPFRRGELPNPTDPLRPFHTEEIELVLTARDFLEHVRVEIIATALADRERKHTHWHRGIFEGALTPGMTETISLFRRAFDFESIQIKNSKGGHTRTKRRRLLDVYLFPQSAALKIDSAFINVEVIVHRKRKPDEVPDRITFTLDVDSVLAPQSRLVPTSGPLEICIPNHYARQFAATMIYEDIDTEISSGNGADAVETLLGFIEQGFRIRDTFLKDNEPIRIKTDRQAWVQTVEQFLSELDRAHFVRFKAARGDGLLPINRNAEGGGLWADIAGKIDALNKIADELRSAKK